MGFDALTTAQLSISECAGRLYVFWSMANDLNTPGAPTDDCTSGGAPYDWRFYANADVFMSVSNDLAGALWDAPRNITNTYTPNCDSATGNGVCMNDVKMAVSRYGMDSSQYGVAMTWQEPPLTMGGTITNDSTLHLFYVEDHYPGQYNLQDASLTFVPTLNPLRYARLACVAPNTAPTIHLEPLVASASIRHGMSAAVTVTVRNSGNTTLTIGSIDIHKDNYAPENWLGVSATSQSVPPASTGTFNVSFTATPFFTAGTIWTAGGSVTLHSNVHTADSVLVIPVGLAVKDDTTESVKIYELDYRTAGPEKPQTVWAWARIAFQPGPGIKYFNLAVNDAWRVKNVPVYAVEGGFPIQSLDILFPLLESTPSVRYGFTITPGIGTQPECRLVDDPTRMLVYWPSGLAEQEVVDTGLAYVAPTAITGGLVADGTAHRHLDFPSQQACVMCCTPTSVSNSLKFLNTRHNLHIPEAELSPEAMKAATHWTAKDGCWGTIDPERGPSNWNTWYAYKKQYLLNNGIPIWTERRSPYRVNEMAAEIDKNNVVEMSFWGRRYDPSENEFIEWGHTASLIGITDVGGGRYSMVFADDLQQGNDSVPTWPPYIMVWDANTQMFQSHVYRTIRNLVIETPVDSVSGCCIATTGNVDGDALDGVDVGDLTKLINNLFITFEAIDCPAEANCDGDGANSVDVGDLTALINNLFITFAPLPACQ